MRTKDASFLTRMSSRNGRNDRMTSLYWTEAGGADLQAVHEYIARDSQVYARRMVNRIKKAVGRLRRFPESGSWVPEWDRPEVREIFVGGYRIIYRIKPQRVEILTVFHGARR